MLAKLKSVATFRTVMVAGAAVYCALAVAFGDLDVAAAFAKFLTLAGL